MFEGKHIHYSPVDNKPLCSYSSKLCRQRRLNGYAFCIRHILEDKSAPFKRCTFVTRNNNQICQNAIPTCQERGYCHSHMQVAGIIPKTERKPKAPKNIGENSNSSVSSNKSDSNGSNSNSSFPCTNNQPRKDPNAVFKFEEEHSEIQWIPKGGSINGIVNSGKISSIKTKEFSFLAKPTNGKHQNTSAQKKEESRNEATEKLDTEKLKIRQTYGKKSKSSLGSPKNGKSSAVTNGTSLCSNSKFGALALSPDCAPENKKLFDEWKTLKNVEKSVRKVGSCLTSSNSRLTFISHSSCKGKEALSEAKETLSYTNANTQVLIPMNIRPAKSSEPRKEFLSRVRQAFKSQYLAVKLISTDGDKNEKIWKRALRNSLVNCVLKDSAYAAHFIQLHDPDKYKCHDTSDLEELKSPASVDSVHHGPNKLNGHRNNDKSNAEQSYQLQIETSSKTENGVDIKVQFASSNSANENKIADGKKVLKLTEVKDGTLLNQNRPQIRKKPKCKSSSSSSNPKDQMKSQENSNLKSKSISIDVEQTSCNGHSESLQELDASMLAKKRKVDKNGSSGSVASDGNTFRIPKTEDSSVGDMDSKAESQSQVVLNNYDNAHVGNHTMLISSSSTKTTLPSAQVQLQQLLSQPDLRTLTNQGIDTVLNSVGSSDLTPSDGVITDASFDSTFEQSASSQPECEFSDEDLEKSLEFQLDPETEHEASRLLEDNELTEDDLNELFPDSRIGDTKLRTDLSDLGVDFSTAFDANDIDYSLFANIFPFSRSNQSESISISNQF